MAGPSSGAHDFTKNPTSNSSSGGNDFTKNPGGSAAASASKPRDLTQGQAPAQPSGDAPDLGDDPVPEGGRILKRDSANTMGDVGTGSMGNSHKPFKGLR